MHETFADLGIPFPLFEASADEAEGYEGRGECSLCRRGGHVFALGIGGDVIVTCSRCGRETAVDADEREGACASCAQVVGLDSDPNDDLRACYACLRAGKCAITKDTVFGMIRWEDAMRGRTHGVPGPAGPWVQTALPVGVMLELLRTPDFSTWQGCVWEFDGQSPMVYVGRWAQRQFREAAPDGDGQALFRVCVKAPPPGDWSDWVAEIPGERGIGVYVFRSQVGGPLRANFDMA